MKRRFIARTKCGKSAFGSEEYANKVIQQIQAKSKPGEKIPIRAYKCDACGKWHLTSREIISEKYYVKHFVEWLKLMKRDEE